MYNEPSLEIKKCDLIWSILSTQIDYTTSKDSSPDTEMNSSNLYSKLSEDEQLITEDSSDQWDERFEEVTCTLHYSHKFDYSSIYHRHIEHFFTFLAGNTVFSLMSDLPH